MIKRITFAPAGGGSHDLRDRVAAGLGAPDDARPGRAAVCVALPELIADPVHDAIGLEWFADAEHHRRFAGWAAGAGLAGSESAGSAAGFGLVVAEEHVGRGGDWLAGRWVDGGPRLKHMAVARRAAGLTPAAFSAAWQNRAGKVGTTPIPDEARGCAYVQNHPLPRGGADGFGGVGPGGDWLYDAVNEVWFDDAEALRTRIRWMDEALATGAEDDLVGAHAFVAVREEVVS